MTVVVFGLTACGTASPSETTSSSPSNPTTSTAVPSAWCTADWTGVTVAPPTGDAAACADPVTREERVLEVVVRLMTPDTFAGMWFEDGGRDLMVGYVGDPPDLDRFPGVTALVERERSLVDMQRLAAERNAGEAIGHRWRVNVRDGTVERHAIEAVFVGDLIQDHEYCAASIQVWLDHGATDADFWAPWVGPDYPAGYWLLQCVDDDDDSQWAVWRLTPGGAEYLYHQPPD